MPAAPSPSPCTSRFVGPDGRPDHQAKTLSVNIPAGVRDGARIRLAGQGGPRHPAGGPAGDLYLQGDDAARIRASSSKT